MDRFRRAGRRVLSFVSGDYPGAPIDFVMALAIVVAAAAVLILAG